MYTVSKAQEEEVLFPETQVLDNIADTQAREMKKKKNTVYNLQINASYLQSFSDVKMNNTKELVF